MGLSSDTSFLGGNDVFFLILLLIPTILFVYVIRWKKKVLAQLGPSLLIKSLIYAYSPTFFLIKFLFTLLAFYLLAFIIFNSKNLQNKEIATGADVMITIDISHSMLCNDVQPSRLKKALSFVNNLIGKSENIRFGIIVFNSKAFLQMPISADTAEAKNISKGITQLNFQASGTNIGTALQLSLRSLTTKEKRVKKIILISDGEDHNSEAIKISNKLCQSGISVITVGVGTILGGGIWIDSSKSYLNDGTGKKITTKLNNVLLKEIANTSKEKYYDLGDEKEAANIILTSINKSYVINESDSKQNGIDTSIYTLLIFVALIFLLVEVFIPEGN